MGKQFSARNLTRQHTGIDELTANARQDDIPIAQIGLDPSQPRRAMPEHLRHDLLTGTPYGDIFEDWIERSRGEGVYTFAWEQVINPPIDQRPVEEDLFVDSSLSKYPYSASWLKLVGLAADIKAVGLQQRIAVYKTGPERYGLLFGERRLLAYTLLAWMGDDAFQAIPALVVERYDPIAQALENGSRQDLGTIERARQLALILFALNNELNAPHAGASWDWYSRAADAGQYRIPRGSLELVLRACGFTQKNQISRYRAILGIPAEVASLAEMLDWPEGKLRTLIATAQEKGYQLVTLARQEAGLEPKPPTDPPSPVDLGQRAYSAVKRVASLDAQEIRKMPPQQRTRLRELLEGVLEKL